MKSKFRLPRNLFVILLLIILLTAIQHLWYFYFISVMIVSLYFLAILLSFKFPHILKKESFVVIRKELIDKQKEEKKKNKDRVRASERLLNLKEQKNRLISLTTTDFTSPCSLSLGFLFGYFDTVLRALFSPLTIRGMINIGFCIHNHSLIICCEG